MDYDVLNQRLRTLASAYARADLSGTQFTRGVAQASTASRLAGQSVERFSRAIFAQSGAQAQAVHGLQDTMRTLRAETNQAMGHIRTLEEGLAHFDEQIAERRRQRAELGAQYQTQEAEAVARIGTPQSVDDFAEARRTQEQLRAAAQVRQLTRQEWENFREASRFVMQARQVLKAKMLDGERQTLTRLKGEMRDADRFISGRLRLAGDLQNQLSAQQGQLQLSQQRFQVQAQQILSSSTALRDAAHGLARAYTLTGAALAVRENWALNQALLAVNSNLEVREKLWQGVLAVQGRTGDSLQNLSELTGVLRGQAMLYRKDWTDILTVTSKLSQGLGASSSEIGEMLNASRALKISFRDLADSVTNVVDKTSLSVRETVSLVTELRRVLTGFNVSAVGGNLENPLRHLAALEQVMKERGATEGSALRVLKQFTSMQQSGGLGLALGSGGVDFLRDPARTKEVTRNMVAMLEPLRNIPMVFEQMAAVYKMSADDAQILIDASKRVGQTERALANDRIDLDKRFAQQSANSGKVWGQFGQQLRALLLEGLTPLTSGVAWLNARLGEFREFLVGVKQGMPDWVKAAAPVGVTTVAVVAMGVAAALAARRVLLTAAALRALSVASPGGAAGRVGGLLGGAPARGVARVATAAPRAVPLPLTSAAALAASRAAGGAAVAGGGAALGGAGFVARLLPLMSAALPVLIPIAVAGVAAWGAYKFFQFKSEKEDRRKEDLARAALEGRAQSYQKVDTLLRDQLKHRDGTSAANNFQTALDLRKKQMLIDAERGSTEGIELLREIQHFRAGRLQAEHATESREQGRAPVERINEIRRGQEALLAQGEKIEQTLRELAVAAARGAEVRQKQAAAEDLRLQEKARVEQAARAAASAGPNAFPGMQALGR